MSNTKDNPLAKYADPSYKARISPDNPLAKYADPSYKSKISPDNPLAKYADGYEEPETSLLTDVKDVGAAFMRGASSIPNVAGQALDFLGADSAGDKLKDIGDTTYNYWDKKISDSGKAAESGGVLSKEDGKLFSDNAFKSVAMGAAGSIPGMIATVPLGGFLATGAKYAGLAGKTALALQRSGISGRIARRIGHLTPTAIGYGSAEGIYSGLENAYSAGKEVDKKTDSQLTKSPYFNKLLEEFGGDFAKARAELKEQVEQQTFIRTAPVTAGIGAVTGGGVLGKMARKTEGGVLKNLLEGARSEGIQETFQSGAEQFAGNTVTKDYVNPEQSLMEGTGEAMVAGGAAGALLGAVGGGAKGYGNKEDIARRIANLETTAKSSPKAAENLEKLKAELRSRESELTVRNADGEDTTEGNNTDLANQELQKQAQDKFDESPNIHVGQQDPAIRDIENVFGKSEAENERPLTDDVQNDFYQDGTLDAMAESSIMDQQREDAKRRGADFEELKVQSAPEYMAQQNANLHNSVINKLKGNAQLTEEEEAYKQEYLAAQREEKKKQEKAAKEREEILAYENYSSPMPREAERRGDELMNQFVDDAGDIEAQTEERAFNKELNDHETKVRRERTEFIAKNKANKVKSNQRKINEAFPEQEDEETIKLADPETIKQARKEALAIVKENPVYAQKAEIKKNGGLSLVQAKQLYGEGFTNSYPGLFQMQVKNGPKPLDIDTTATEYGYESADEMFRAFSAAPTIKSETAKLVRQYEQELAGTLAAQERETAIAEAPETTPQAEKLTGDPRDNKRDSKEMESRRVEGKNSDTRGDEKYLQANVETSKRSGEKTVLGEKLETVQQGNKSATPKADTPSTNPKAAQAKEYRYAMVNRPFGIGTAPKEGFIRAEDRPAKGETHHDYARNGVAVYNRELTDAETKQFEMAPMANHIHLGAYADAVAKSLKRYASQYVDIYKNDRSEFERTVMDRLKSTANGYPPSVGDIGKFSAMVTERLKSQQAGAKDNSSAQAGEKEKQSTKDASRTLNTDGRPSDGGVIKPGDTFTTTTGRTTTPYPRYSLKRSTKPEIIKLNQWQIDNAVAEAESRGDEFNSLIFRNTDATNFSVSDSDGIHEYLFGDNQPEVLKRITKPLSEESTTPTAKDSLTVEKPMEKEEVKFSKSSPELTEERVIGSMTANTIRQEFGDFISDDLDGELSFLADGNLDDDFYYIHEALEQNGNNKTVQEFVESEKEEYDAEIESGTKLEEFYEPYETQGEPKPEEYESRARSNYGITYNPRTAGYILSNGDLLDLGGGSSTDRGLDHRVIAGEVRRPTSKNSSRYGAIEEFGAVTGAIRMHYQDNGYVTFDILKKPTKDQVDAMLGMVSSKTEVTIDYVDENGTTQSVEGNGGIGSKQAIQKASRKAHTTTVNYSKRRKSLRQTIKLPKSQQSDIATELSERKNIGKFGLRNLTKKGVLEIVSPDRARQILGTVGGAKYMTAYHGSPHSFDKFSTENIGTGEGAQAYGYGLYFAGSREVAEYYKKVLSSVSVNLDGKELTQERVDEIASHEGFDYDDAVISFFRGNRRRFINKSFFIDALDDEIYDFKEDLLEAEGDGGYEKTTLDRIRKRYTDLSSFRKRIDVKKDTGNLYQVDLAPKEEEYLLWDKPLSEQSEKVKAALMEKIPQHVVNRAGYLISNGKMVEKTDGGRELTGRDIYLLHKIQKSKIIRNMITGENVNVSDDKAASEYLHSIGIRGIKYADGMTRNKENQNFNYVIFDDNDVKIEAKYSKAGAIEAFYLNGKSYLVQGNIAKGQAMATLTHELAIHAQKLGFKDSKQFNRILTGLVRRAKLNNAEGLAIREAMARVPKDTPLKDKNEEILAYLISNSPNISTVRRFIAEIKRFLVEKMGINEAVLKNIDLQALALNVVKREARGTVGVSPQVGGEAAFPLFSQTGQTIPQRLKRWLGASKLKDKAGNPIVAYHGSPNEFYEFGIPEKRGKTGHTSSGLGDFFSLDKKTSEKYGNAKPFYLKMENPYIMTLKESQGFNTVADSARRSEELQEQGYDSILIKVPGKKENSTNPYLVVFKGNQVKSADNNNGEYSLTNNDVRYSVNTEITKSGIGGDIIAEEEGNPEDNQALTEVSKRLGTSLKPMEVKGEKSDMLRKVARAFGTRVVFYTDESYNVEGQGGDSTNRGFVYGENTVFLNTRSGSHLLFVLGHEISHAIGVKSPAFYKNLLDEIKPYVDKTMYAAFEKNLLTINAYKGIDEATIYQEFVGDLMGNLFVTDKFWSTIAKEKPTLFRVLADAVDYVMSKVNEVFVSNTGATEAVTDIGKVNRVMVDALKVYSLVHGEKDYANNKITRFSLTNNDVRYSIATDFVDTVIKDKPRWNERVERFAYNWLNTNDPRKRIYASADKKTAKNDIVTIEELRGKKTAEETKRTMETVVEPMLKDLAKGKLSVSDLEEYSHALHAPERNQRMREVNAKRKLDLLFNQMTDKEAAPWKQKIADLRSETVMDEDLDNKDTQQGYLKLIDEISGNVISRESELDKRQRELGTREFTDDEISKGTPENLQKRIDGAIRRLDATKEILDIWNVEKTMMSGMTDEEANSILDKWDKDSRLVSMKSAKEKLDKINRMGIEALHDSGELTDEEYNGVINGYENYVPLQRDGFLETSPTSGRITGPTGKPLKVAKGSMREVVNIVAHSVRNYQNAVNRKNKSFAGQALYQFVLDNPNSGLTISDIAKQPTHDKEGNIVMYPTMAEPEDGVFVKVREPVTTKAGVPITDRDGIQKERNVKKLITFDIDQRTAQGRTVSRFLDSIKGQDAQLGPMLSSLSKINRYLATVNTMLSPEFVLSNFVKDFQTAFVHLSDENIKKGEKGLRTNISKDIFPAIKGIFQAEKGNENSEMAKWYREFAKEGGKVGWMQGYDKIEDLASSLEHTMKLHGEGHTTLKKVEAIKNLVSMSNTAVENGVRLATYKNLVQRGVPKSEAASVASKLTVDFTQHGKYGPALNSLYLFANAGIQGNIRMVQAIGRSSKVRKIVGGIVVSGFALQMLAIMSGGDDDTGEPYILGVPDFERERNMIFMRPGSGGKYFKIPMPYGYNVFNNIGAEAANMFYLSSVGKDYNVSNGAMRIVTTFANSFNPLASGTILQTLSPTIADPIVQAAENKNFMGTDLMPRQNQFGTEKPDSERYWKNVSATSKYVSSLVNRLTFGDKFKGGMIDVSPETLDMLYETVTGSTGKFVSNVLHFPIRAASGELEQKDVPFTRRFSGSWDDRAISNRYYEAIKSGDISKQRFDGATTKKERMSIKRSYEYRQHVLSIPTQKQLRVLRRALKLAEARGRKETVKNIKGKITNVQMRYLQRLQK